MKSCKHCKKSTVYNDKYDSYCCLNCNEWTESNCSDPMCTYCKKRPFRPMKEKDLKEKPTIVHITLKPCPWCKKTPELDLPLDSGNLEGTWKWSIRCNNECPVNPISKHVSLRKTTKRDPYKITEKLNSLATKWNQGIEGTPYESLKLDLTPILQD